MKKLSGQLSAECEKQGCHVVIDGHGWNPGVIGISASRILEQYNPAGAHDYHQDGY